MRMHYTYRQLFIALILFSVSVAYCAGVHKNAGNALHQNEASCRTLRGNTVYVWEKQTENNDIDIFARRVSPSGESMWQPEEICVHEFRGNQTHPKVVPAADDGVFVVWQSDSAGTDNINLWSRHIAVNGTPTWPTPFPVSTAPGNQTDQVVAPDIDGGFLVAWVDYRDGNADVYGQYIQSDGSPAGTEDGVPIEIAPGDQADVTFTFTTNNVVKGIAWKDHSSPLKQPARVETDISRIPIPEPGSFIVISVMAVLIMRRMHCRIL